jgi:hypothetical protein
MAKSPRTCDRLLMVLVNRKGAVSESDIAAEMQYDSMYRISTEFWRLKKRGAVIKTVRDGRKVAGYELVNVDEMKTYLNGKGFASFTPTKVAKTATPKAPAKTAAAKTVKAPVVEKTAAATVAPVDVLDEIDTDITDFEDRAFAEDVVSGRV